METAIAIAGWWMAGVIVLLVLFQPMLIGKPRDPMTAWDVALSMVAGKLPMALLIGRALGWW